MADISDSDKITRVTLPTASFSLTVPQIEWIETEAAKRGIKKSVLVREILDAARQQTQEQEQAA